MATNETIGEIRSSYMAARNANLALSLAEAIEQCEAEGFLEDHQAKVDEASKKLDAAREKAYQARKVVGEQLGDFNRALSRAELINDSVDLAGAGLALAGTVATGGTLGAVLIAGGGLGAEVFTTFGRPDDPSVLGAINSGSNLSSGVIGVGDAVAQLPDVPLSQGGVALPSLVREGLGTVDGVVGAAGNVVTVFRTEARQLALSNQTLDGLRDFKTRLNQTDLTFVEDWSGADKDALNKALDEAIAAEEEYQAAFEEWKKALNQDWLAQESTCIQNKQRAIDASGPVSLDQLEHEGEVALQELNEAERLGKRTFNAEQKLKAVRDKMLRRARTLALPGGG